MVLCWLAGSARGGTIPSDGLTDATTALQAALNESGRAGGEVFLPAGKYLIGGKLTVPAGVTLRGSWEEPHHGLGWEKGTCVLVTGGRNCDQGATVTLATNSALKGLTFLWPEERWNNIVAYPWAIFGDGIQVSVENVTLINPYQGIKLGGPNKSNKSNMHLLRNIFGSPLRYGVFIDNCHDIGRIENVHFNPNYWLDSGDPSASEGMDPTIKVAKRHQNDFAVLTYQLSHLEAFVFGRADWEYVLNTFVFGAHIGYHFIKTENGIPNGQLSGIGSDFGPICIQVDAIKAWGLQVTNGQFNNNKGVQAAAIITSPGAEGSVQFANCSFWATQGHAAWLQGQTTVKFTSCSFNNMTPGGTILAENGKLILNGCDFDQPGSAVILKPGVSAAVIMGNLQPGGLQIENEVGKRAQIGLNETP